MTKEFCGITVRNAEKFEEFIKKNLKSECYDIDACWNCFIENFEQDSGKGDYELSQFETKSRNPELISYRTTHIYHMPNGKVYKLELTADGWESEDGSMPDDLDEFDELEYVIEF